MDGRTGESGARRARLQQVLQELEEIESAIGAEGGDWREDPLETIRDTGGVGQVLQRLESAHSAIVEALNFMAEEYTERAEEAGGGRRGGSCDDETRIRQAGEESFPASDPPSYNGGRI